MEKEYKIIWLEVKSPEWKIATLSDDVAQYANTSINKVNKKGEVFPNFDEISNGGSVKGNLWQSPQGKYYLFAPKVAVAGQSGAFKGLQIAKAQEKKAEYIATAQDNKNEGIKIASTLGKAVDCAIAEHALPDNDHSLEDLIRKWRRTLWFEWDNVNDFPPFE